MGLLVYNISEFNKEKAQSGFLCVMVSAQFWNVVDPSTGVITHPEQISNLITSGPDKDKPNQDFGGAGICKYQNSFKFTVNSKTYSFNNIGEPLDSSSAGWLLVMGSQVLDLYKAGNAIKTNTTTVTTKKNAEDGTTITDVETEYNSNTNNAIVIDSLNARDHFAVQALRELLARSERDPATLSDNEISYYCNQAYQWAANMMTAAANARGSVKTTDAEGYKQETKAADLESLDTNTEKLLNNLIVELEKTNEKSGSDNSVIYSERVINPTLNASIASYVAGNDGTTLGLKDLITAINNAGSGGGSTTVDFSTLITALNTTQTFSVRGALPDVSIGNEGLGRDSNHPLYISGGGFPSRQVLPAAFPAESIHDFLTFNADGATGYSTLEESKKAVLGWLNAYASIQALYNDLESRIDARIQAWLSAAKDSLGGSLQVNSPS